MQNKNLSEYISELKSFINANDYLPCIDLLLQAIEHYPHEEKLKLNLGNIYKMLDHPSMQSPEIMIRRIEELIKQQTI